MAADGSDPRTLPGAYGWLGPIWSPDGTKLVVGNDGAFPTPFYVLDPTGSAPPARFAPPGLGEGTSIGNLAEIPAWQRRAP